jgi:hypothetical protein
MKIFIIKEQKILFLFASSKYACFWLNMLDQLFLIKSGRPFNKYVSFLLHENLYQFKY